MTHPASPLFRPMTAGSLTLKNRVLMAPMTRSRADDAGLVGELTATYYAQRAGAGLIVSEGIYPEAAGKGYVRTPGLANAAQVAAWRRVTDAVHARGGTIVAQIMHAGRISHPALQPGHALPVAPSAVKPAGTSYTDAGPQAHETPRALDIAEIRALVRSHADAAERAIEAGFDGVELHAGNGYLGMQFLTPNANLRTDEYGGSAANRVRFVVEALEAMGARIGFDRVGLKVTPGTTFNDMHDPDPLDTYRTLVDAIAHLPLAFIDVSPADAQRSAAEYHALLRPRWRGAYFSGGGLTQAAAEALVAEGHIDAALFGSAYIANPDLPARFGAGAALAMPDPSTFYTPGAAGYTDYPVMAGVQAA